jgi:uncharacterized repeat protein (TIGR03803 family)
MRKLTNCAAAAAFVALSSGLAVCAPAEAQLTVLHQFTGGADGGTPYAALISDAAGNLYGTTSKGGSSNYGTAYELSPPAAGGSVWDETVLYSFDGGLGGDGSLGALVFDKAGNLYGMASGGSVAHPAYRTVGNIFELTPPAAGKSIWGHQILRQFTVADQDHGGHPYYAALILDAQGVLYGTTMAPNIFSLSPPVTPGGIWQFKNLAFIYNAPKYGSLAFDRHGALYGTTDFGPGNDGVGTIYQLNPPAAGQKTWHNRTILTFTRQLNAYNPQSGVTFDEQGNIYGTTTSGTIYKLSPADSTESTWKYSSLYTFKGGSGSDPSDGFLPVGPVALGVSLYGTTLLGGSAQCTVSPPAGIPNNGCGVIYRLMPPAAGKTTWTEKVLYRFTGGNDGAYPYAGLLVKDGALYGTTWGGGQYGHGTVFKINP